MQSTVRILFAAALLACGALAANTHESAVEKQPQTPPEGFALIPAGQFLMGSPASERQRQKDEAQHSVTLRAFYLAKHEVTQGDYAAVMGANPSHFKGENLPVENISWLDAIEYANRLSQKHRLTPAYSVQGGAVTWDRNANGYRLPTEAEWEYAARAGTQTVFYAGEHITSRHANFQGSYPYLIEENYVQHHNPDVVTSTNRGAPMPVDTLDANRFGLHHMQGNVSEWCFDYYGAYDATPAENPAGPVSGALRVNRGGAYNDFAKHLRSAYRSANPPTFRDRNLGLRLARNAPGENAGAENLYATAAAPTKAMPAQPKILIAWFSYSGNTERAADIIKKKTGADSVEIAMQKPYRGNIYEASQRDLNKDFHPPLSTRLESVEKYDVILLGYPTWWATIPMPVFTFLESHNWAGKIIIPFSSHGGTIYGDSLSDLGKMTPGAFLGQPFEFHYSGGGSLSRDIERWLADNGIKTR